VHSFIIIAIVVESQDRGVWATMFEQYIFILHMGGLLDRRMIYLTTEESAFTIHADIQTFTLSAMGQGTGE